MMFIADRVALLGFWWDTDVSNWTDDVSDITVDVCVL